MSNLLVEQPTNVNLTANHSADNLNMSNAPYLQSNINELVDDCQFEHILSQLEQYWPLREQVAKALREANSAFAAQCIEPDGYTFTATCEDLKKFLDIKVTLEYSEQKLVVQVLQVALAMHENAVNNPKLTPTQRSSHFLATTALLPLCRTALESNITYNDLWCDVFQLVHRAEQAYAKATDELDLSKYFDFDNVQYDPFSGSRNSPDPPSATPSPKPTATRPAKPRGSIHDIAVEASLTPRSAKLKEEALAMLNDPPYKAAPLGRRHTAPTLSPTTATSRTSGGRTSSKVHSRGNGRALQALQDVEE